MSIPDVYYPQQLATMPSLEHKNYAITGCTSGTGYFFAKAAISKNANMVLLLNRPSARAIKAHKKLSAHAKASESNTILYTVDCDLQCFESVKKCARMVEALCANTGGLDALVNNAGIMGVPDTRTVDGLDVQMQTNHLSHFLLSYLLMSSLELAANTRGESRVVQHSSGARAGSKKKGMLQAKYFNKCASGTLGGDGLGACFKRYHQTKLANSVFAMALHELLKKSGSKVKSVCAEPGVAATDLGANLQKNHDKYGSQKAPDRGSTESRFPGVQSAADGACPLMEAAFGQNVGSGDFFMPRNLVKNTVVGMPTKCMTDGSPSPSTDYIKKAFKMEELTMLQENRTLLWRESEKVCGITWNIDKIQLGLMFPQLETEFLGVLDAQLGDEILPVQPDGKIGRMVVPVVGGTFKGSKFNAEILPFAAADWIRLNSDGSKQLDVRMELKTTEGEYILLTYLGKISNGVNRVGMLFETSSKKLSFLNHAFAIGIGGSFPGKNNGTRSAKYQVYNVTQEPSML